MPISPTDSRSAAPDAAAPSDAAKPAGRADDLISEMAGKEIDRMLADAGISPAEPTASVATAAPAVATADLEAPLPVADAVVAPIDKELDQIVDRQLGDDASDKPSVESAVPDSPAAMAERPVAPDPGGSLAVDDLLHRLSPGAHVDPTVPAATGPSTEMSPPQSHREAIAAQDGGTGSASPGGNASADGNGSADARSQPKEPAAEPAMPLVLSASMTDRAPGLFGRTIDLLASPLDPFPDRVRDFVGKIAIVTALNAAAVLAYVVFFRK